MENGKKDNKEDIKMNIKVVRASDFARKEDVQEWEDWFLETEDDYYDDVDSYFIDDKKMEEFEEELYGQLKG